mmetsp:Transcript_90181/g.254371  ORF Transcript_90181/g.254371 Transcript_90181/m.254371 type:complete len:250 (-) Transcript_90181:722-1471(-)
MAPVRLLWKPPVPRRSCKAETTVTMQSKKPSGSGRPSSVSTASVNMWCPTLRTRQIDRPGSIAASPFSSLNQMSLFIFRVIARPSLRKGASNVPRKMPLMFVYTRVLSSASTTETESSMSRMAVSALSMVMSLIPLSALAPMGCSLSTSRIRWRLLCFKKIRPLSGTVGAFCGFAESGGPRLPLEPTKSAGVLRLVVTPELSKSSSCCEAPTNRGHTRVTSFHFPSANGAISSNKPFANSITASPRTWL